VKATKISVFMLCLYMLGGCAQQQWANSRGMEKFDRDFKHCRAKAIAKIQKQRKSSQSIRQGRDRDNENGQTTVVGSVELSEYRNECMQQRGYFRERVKD
jgi:hypothetical protein